MALFIFAVLSPIFVSFYYGMTDYTGIAAPNIVGFKNFKEIIVDDPIFWHSLFNAVLLAIGYILIQHPFCITFAIMLDRLGGGLEKFFRTIFFVPCVISIVVTSKMWVNILEPNFGLLNKVLEIIGLGFLKKSWLGDTRFALASILVILMWQGFGWGLLVYYAGLKGIPEELYEAARIDGASGIKLYSRITMPLLKPVIRVNVTLAIIAAFKQMETVYLTTNGGPGNSTQFLANYLYIKAFNSYEYGYANAISVLFVTVCLIVTYLFNRILKTEMVEY